MVLTWAGLLLMAVLLAVGWVRCRRFYKLVESYQDVISAMDATTRNIFWNGCEDGYGWIGNNRELSRLGFIHERCLRFTAKKAGRIWFKREQKENRLKLVEKHLDRLIDNEMRED